MAYAVARLIVNSTSCRSQVAAYVVIAVLAALFFGLLSPAIISRDVRVVLESLYAALAAAVVTFVVIATCAFCTVAMMCTSQSNCVPTS
jgi:uncharacterized membrane protein